MMIKNKEEGERKCSNKTKVTLEEEERRTRKRKRG
jgi:hypothetical protein